MTWQDVTHASAFLFGFFVGIVLTVRVVKAVTAVLTRTMREDNAMPTNPTPEPAPAPPPPPPPPPPEPKPKA